VLELAAQFPRARFILAHAGVCDLAWIWRRAGEHPNVFFDTAWFSVPDLLTLFTHVAPGGSSTRRTSPSDRHCTPPC
jgi:hypothetical protein